MLLTDERRLLVIVAALFAQIPITLAIHHFITEFTVPYLVFCLLVLAGTFLYSKVKS